MRIEALSLVNFRNYARLDLHFSPSLNIIYGNNGLGKTNIIEAIYYLSLTKSYRVNNEKFLVKKNENNMIVKGKIYRRDMISYQEIDICKGERVVKINDNTNTLIGDYITRFVVIMFNPRDTRLIDDAPAERRKMLNMEISKIHKDYLLFLTNYNKILKQRNFYIRSMYINGNRTNDFLEILTKKLVEYGLYIAKMREEFINSINQVIGDVYQSIFGSGKLQVKYASVYKNKSKDELLKKYQTSFQKELEIGKTLFGIHHDDLVFMLDNEVLKDFGSEGQRKNAVLSFKMAEVKIINEIKGEYPVLILDDLFSELDKDKAGNLVKMLDFGVQTFITTTDLKKIKKKLLSNAKKFEVLEDHIKEEI